MTREGIDALVANGREDVTKVLGTDGEKQIREGTEKHYAMYERLSNKILTNFVQFLKVY